MIAEQPEAVVDEVIRVHSDLDRAGKVVSCTATPAGAGADIGGCRAFGDLRMLGHLVARPLTAFAWIEMRMTKRVSPDGPAADPIPAGAIRTVLARATVTIAPDGSLAGCTNDAVLRVDGRAFDLCAVGAVDPAARFAPAADPAPRRLTMTFETVAQPR